MKKYNYIYIAVFLLGFASCAKTNDNIKTKVGFYLSDKTTSSNEISSYKLFIDNEYKGKIYGLNYEPNESDVKVLFYNLDEKRHEIDLKNDKEEFVSSGYLQLHKKSTKSGSGKQSCNIEGINGSSYSKKPNNSFGLYSFMKNN